jgi:tetratricopeptide (TPR) repeat protein
MATSPTPPSSASPARRSATSAALVVVVAVLIGLGIGRFVTAGSAEPATTTSTVAASADLGERIGQLERAVASDPDDLDSLQGLGAAYVDRAAQTGDAAFYRLADTALTRAEQLDPDDPETVLVRGLLNLSLHQFDDALRAGQKALESRPDSAAVLGVVVDAQVELGRYDQAAETLQDMLDRDPGLPALARASYLRELSGDVEGAVTAMQQAQSAGLSSSYSLAAVTTLLGDLLMQQGELDAAAAAYDEALRGSPDLTAARIGAARVQAVRGDLTGAVAALQQLTQERPSVLALLTLADLQRAVGQADEAGDTAAVVRAVADLQGEAGQIVDLEMSLFEADAGDPATSLELARGAHAARPDNVFTTDALGWAMFRSGDTAAAAARSTEALRLGSESPALRWHAAEIAAAGEDDDAARQHLAIVMRGAPYAPGVDAGSVVRLAGELGMELPPLWQLGAAT